MVGGRTYLPEFALRKWGKSYQICHDKWVTTQNSN